LDDLGDFRVEARLDGQDALPSDDRAWAVPGPSGERAVRLLTTSQQNRFLSVPFRLLPDVAFSQGNVLSDTAVVEDEEPADLLILDRWLPEEGLPGTTENLLIVAPPAGNDVIQTTGVLTNPLPIATGNLPSLEESLFFEEDLFFVEARVGELPAWGTAVLEDGVTGAPLLWVGEQNGRRVAVLNLALYGVPESIPIDPPRDVVLTNFVYHPAYPVLMVNVANYLLAGPAGGLAGTSVAPGEVVNLPLLEGGRVQVQTPTGETITPQVAEDTASTPYIPTEPGVYTVSWPGGQQPPVQFTVNLFAPTESTIAPVPTLQLASGGDTPVAESGLEGEARRDLWRPLLLVGLLILAAEWLVYQRDALARLRGWFRARTSQTA
jgi:hypothetical protein